jgi:hypothetical protein
MICPRCHKEAAILHPTLGVLPGKRCQARDTRVTANIRKPEFYAMTKQDRVNHQRDRNAKDILQPFDGTKPNREFAKAYPERAHDYFKPSELKQL